MRVLFLGLVFVAGCVSTEEARLALGRSCLDESLRATVRLSSCEAVIEAPRSGPRDKALSLSGRGDIRLAQRDWDGARADHEAAFSLEPELPVVQSGIGRMELRVGRPDTAAGYLERPRAALAAAIVLVGDEFMKAPRRSGEALAWLTALSFWERREDRLLLDLSHSRLLLEQPTMALDVLRERSRRSRLAYQGGAGWGDGLQCVALVRLHRVNEGQASCREAERRAVLDDGMPHALAAGVYLMLGDDVAANAAIREALRRSPNLPEATWLQGALFERQGRSQEAQEARASANRNDPFLEARWAPLFGPRLDRPR